MYIYYKHYKGNVYRFLGLAMHSETHEAMVVYETENKSEMWVRPATMFFESVDGKPRFQRLLDYTSEYDTRD